MQTARILGLLATLALIAASMSMNGIFLYSQGKTPVESWIFVIVSVAVDCFKALLPMVIAEAWIAGQRFKVAAGGALLALLITFSFGSSLGYAAMNRGFRAETRFHETGELKDLERQVERLDTMLKRGPDVRPAAVIERELAAQRIERAWETSKGCAELVSREVRDFCRTYRATEAELATATELARQSAARAALKAKIATMVAAGAGQESDALAAFFTRWLGIATPVMRDVLIVGVALVVELGSAFGLFLSGYELRRKPVETPAPPMAASLPARPLSRRIGGAVPAARERNDRGAVH